MSKIYFETMEDKNNYIEKLKQLTIAKDEMLYDMIKDDNSSKSYREETEEQRVRYKSTAEIIREGGKCCDNCKHNNNKFGTSVRCTSEECKKAGGFVHCIENDHKYWEAK